MDMDICCAMSCRFGKKCFMWLLLSVGGQSHVYSNPCATLWPTFSLYLLFLILIYYYTHCQQLYDISSPKYYANIKNSNVIPSLTYYSLFLVLFNYDTSFKKCKEK